MGVKTNLTPLERIQVAHAHFFQQVEQDTLASIFGVNGGRVNEACKAIWMAAEDPKRVRPNYGKPKKRKRK